MKENAKKIHFQTFFNVFLPFFTITTKVFLYLCVDYVLATIHERKSN